MLPARHPDAPGDPPTGPLSGERMIHKRTILIAVAVVLLTPSVLAQGRLRSYPGRYYVIYTDLDRDAVREIDLRLTHMAREYARRTSEFGGATPARLPFYVFRHERDYRAAGGKPGTAGVFTGQKLMAWAGDRITPETWRVVQHEGFHQFITSVVSAELPIWVHEGLAEYFGEALFTGDGYVCGIVPPERLVRLQQWLAGDEMSSIRQMMRLSHASWNEQMSVSNYDQAWSMVHFLAHAEDGRYQRPFSNFIRLVSQGQAWEQAWRASFGSELSNFEQRWRAWWRSQTPDTSRKLYARATVATLTSFLARAVAQKQHFDSAEEFFQLARSGTLRSSREDWLPPDLLEGALQTAPDVGRWTLRRRGNQTQLICQAEDFSAIGSFALQRGRVQSVAVKLAGPSGR